MAEYKPLYMVRAVSSTTHLVKPKSLTPEDHTPTPATPTSKSADVAFELQTTQKVDAATPTTTEISSGSDKENTEKKSSNGELSNQQLQLLLNAHDPKWTEAQIIARFANSNTKTSTNDEKAKLKSAEWQKAEEEFIKTREPNKDRLKSKRLQKWHAIYKLGINTTGISHGKTLDPAKQPNPQLQSGSTNIQEEDSKHPKFGKS